MMVSDLTLNQHMKSWKTLISHIKYSLELLRRRANITLPFSNFLWQQILMDVGQNTTICNSNCSQEFAELLIIPHSQLNVPWNNTVLLVVPCCITSKFKNLYYTSNTIINSNKPNDFFIFAKIID